MLLWYTKTKTFVMVKKQPISLTPIYLGEKNADTLHLYITEIKEFADLDINCEVRRNEILACKSERVKRQKYWAWKLLDFACKDLFCKSIDEFNPTKNSKWTADGFNFSISHSEIFCAVAINFSPVGVDLESVTKFDKKTAERKEKLANLFDNFNLERFKSASISPLLILWTQYESLFKANGNAFKNGKLAVSLNQSTYQINLNGDIYCISLNCTPNSLVSNIVEF